MIKMPPRSVFERIIMAHIHKHKYEFTKNGGGENYIIDFWRENTAMMDDTIYRGRHLGYIPVTDDGFKYYKHLCKMINAMSDEFDIAVVANIEYIGTAYEIYDYNGTYLCADYLTLWQHDDYQLYKSAETL